MCLWAAARGGMEEAQVGSVMAGGDASAPPPPPPQEEGQLEGRTLLERTLVALVQQVVKGIPGVPSQEPIVDCARKLLDKCDGNVGKAVQSVATTADSAWGDSCIRFLAGLVPLGGMAIRLESLWVQLRAVALVAALYGHDVQDSVICNRMVLCLIDARMSGPAPPRKKDHDPLALGARRVVTDVAKRVSDGGTMSVLVDSLNGNSIEAVVIRARQHFAPQNKLSNAWLMMLFGAAIVTRVVKPTIVAARAATAFIASLLGSGGHLQLLGDLAAWLPFGTSLVFALVAVALVLFGSAMLFVAARSLLWSARISPAVFSFVVMCVPPVVQASLAASSAQALGTALANGSLFRVTETSTEFLVSYLVHHAVYGCCVVLCQRIDSPALVSGTTGLQYLLLYWPAEALWRWSANGMVFAELLAVGSVCADAMAIVSLSLLSKELQSTRVMIKLLQWGMTGESSALCQSIMTVATEGGITIGSALVANPGQLVDWIDRATPSAAACSFVLALSMVGPHTAAFSMFAVSSELVPGREARVQWGCAIISIVSVTMNYLWQSKSEQLTSRCRIFLLLPGNNQMQVLRSAVRWIESYESSRKHVSSAVERWWSETGDGWLSFGFGGGNDGGDTTEIAENENPGYVVRLAQSISSTFGATEVVPGPDPRVQTKAFPAAYLQELEEMQRKAEEEWQAKCDAEMEAMQTEREAKMAQLDEEKAQVESEPLSEARIERLGHVEKTRLSAANHYEETMAALERKREEGLKSLKNTAGVRQPDPELRPEASTAGLEPQGEPEHETELEPVSALLVPEPGPEPEAEDGTAAYMAKRLGELTSDLQFSLTQQLAPAPEPEQATGDDGESDCAAGLEAVAAATMPEPEHVPEPEPVPALEPEPQPDATEADAEPGPEAEDGTAAYMAKRLGELTSDLQFSLTQQLAPAPEPEQATDDDGESDCAAGLAAAPAGKDLPPGAMLFGSPTGTKPEAVDQGTEDDRGSTAPEAAADTAEIPDAPEGEPPPSARPEADGFDDEDFDDLDDLVYKK